MGNNDWAGAKIYEPEQAPAAVGSGGWEGAKVYEPEKPASQWANWDAKVRIADYQFPKNDATDSTLRKSLRAWMEDNSDQLDALPQKDFVKALNRAKLAILESNAPEKRQKLMDKSWYVEVPLGVAAGLANATYGLGSAVGGAVSAAGDLIDTAGGNISRMAGDAKRAITKPEATNTEPTLRAGKATVGESVTEAGKKTVEYFNGLQKLVDDNIRVASIGEDDIATVLTDPAFWGKSIGQAAGSMAHIIVIPGSTATKAVVGGAYEALPGYTENRARGDSPSDAFARATIFGALVAAGEKVGLDAILDGKSLSKFGRISIAGLSEGTTEYLEEPEQAVIDFLGREGITLSDYGYEVVSAAKRGLDMLPGAALTGGGMSAANRQATKQPSAPPPAPTATTAAGQPQAPATPAEPVSRAVPAQAAVGPADMDAIKSQMSAMKQRGTPGDVILAWGKLAAEGKTAEAEQLLTDFDAEQSGIGPAPAGSQPSAAQPPALGAPAAMNVTDGGGQPQGLWTRTEQLLGRSFSDQELASVSDDEARASQPYREYRFSRSEADAMRDAKIDILDQRMGAQVENQRQAQIFGHEKPLPGVNYSRLNTLRSIYRQQPGVSDAEAKSRAMADYAEQERASGNPLGAAPQADDANLINTMAATGRPPPVTQDTRTGTETADEGLQRQGLQQGQEQGLEGRQGPEADVAPADGSGAGAVRPGLGDDAAVGGVSESAVSTAEGAQDGSEGQDQAGVGQVAGQEGGGGAGERGAGDGRGGAVEGGGGVAAAVPGGSEALGAAAIGSGVQQSAGVRKPGSRRPPRRGGIVPGGAGASAAAVPGQAGAGNRTGQEDVTGAKTGGEVEAKPPELMTPEEWAKSNLSSGLLELAKDGSPENQANREALLQDHYDAVRSALKSKRPVSSDAVNAYTRRGIEMPQGYVREGDRYVYRGGEGEKATAPAATPAAPTPTPARPKLAAPTAAASAHPWQIPEGTIQEGSDGGNIYTFMHAQKKAQADAIAKTLREAGARVEVMPWIRRSPRGRRGISMWDVQVFNVSQEQADQLNATRERGRQQGAAQAAPVATPTPQPLSPRSPAGQPDTQAAPPSTDTVAPQNVAPTGGRGDSDAGTQAQVGTIRKGPSARRKRTATVDQSAVAPTAVSTLTADGQTVTSPAGEAAASRDTLTGSQQKKYLIAEIDKAIEGAKDDASDLQNSDEMKSLLDQRDKIASRLAALRDNSVGLEGDARSKALEQISADQGILDDIERQRRAIYGTVTIEVPGDGTFELLNTKDALRKFKEMAKKFPTSPARQDAPRSSSPAPTAIAPVVRFRPTSESDMVAAIRPMTSKDETRAVLQQVHVDGKAKVMVATDGRRLAAILDAPFKTTKHKVPEFKTEKDSRGKSTTYATGNIVDGEFPNWQQVIPGGRDGKMPKTGYENSATIDTGDMLMKLNQAEGAVKAIKSTKSKADGMDTPLVALYRMPDGSVEMATKHVDVGGYESARVADGSPIGAYTLQYLADAMTFFRKMGNSSVRIEWADQRSPVMFLGKREFYVLMPMSEVGDMTLRPKAAYTEVDGNVVPNAETVTADTPTGITPELARRLLSLPPEDIVHPSSDHNAELRRDVLEALTGTRPPKSKAGAGAVRDALAAHFNAPKDAIVVVERHVIAKLREIAGVAQELVDNADAAPSTEQTQESATASDIEAGEELTYNRRNRVARRTWADFSALNPALKAREVQKNSIWPTPDYQSLVESADIPTELKNVRTIIVHVAKQVRDAIAAKPSVRGVPTDEDFKRYVDGVQRVESGVAAWMRDAENGAVEWLKRQGRSAGTILGTMRGVPTSVTDLADKGPQKTLLDFVYPDGWKAHRDELIALGGNKLLGRLQPHMDELRRAMKDAENGWPSKREAWQVQGWRVIDTGLERPEILSGARYKDGVATPVIRLSVGGRKGGTLPDVYPSTEAAKTAAITVPAFVLFDKRGNFRGGYATEEEAIEAARAASKREASGQKDIEGTNVAAAERIGTDRRLEGEDISAEKLRDTFGFKGVNFGNWMQGPSARAEAQAHLNAAYDALLDLAEILNVPPKALSMDGMLGLAIGAQGSGKHAAHFVPGVNEINITRTRGAGALAHEWAHGLDHYFGTLAGYQASGAPYITEHVGQIGPDGYIKKDGKKVPAFEGVRPEIAAAFNAIVDRMRKKAITPERQAEMAAERLGRQTKGVDSWLREIRRSDFSGNEEVFDLLAERVRNEDFGDGKIAVGNAGQLKRGGFNAALSPVVDEMRQLYKTKNGRLPNVDPYRKLQTWIDMVIYQRSHADASATHIPQTMETDYLAEATKLDKDKKGKLYWTTDREMFARALDAYVTDKLEENAAKNTYLAGLEIAAPAGDERKAINAAFDTLVGEIKTRETDRGVAMFSQRPSSPFYSALSRAVESLPDGFKAPGDQFLRALEGRKNKGYPWKAQEAEESGLLDFLKMQQENGKTVTKADALAWIEGNGVRVEEVRKGGEEDMEDISRRMFGQNFGNLTEQQSYAVRQEFERQTDNQSPKFFTYAPPGGVPGTYREVLVTVPIVKTPEVRQVEKSAVRAADSLFGEDEEAIAGYAIFVDGQQVSGAFDTLEEANAKASSMHSDVTATYTSPHWSEPNVIAHMLMDERRIPLDVLEKTQPEMAARLRSEGKTEARALHMIEGQSDIHAAGQHKGYTSKKRQDEMARLRKEKLDLEVSARRYTLRGEDAPQDMVERQAALGDRIERLAREDIEGMPNLPMKGDAWKRLVIRKMLSEAASGGYDMLTWSTGEDRFKKWGSQRVDWKKTIGGKAIVRDLSEPGLPPRWGVFADGERYGLVRSTRAQAEADAAHFEKQNPPSGDAWTVSAREQHGGAHDGQNLETLARERGVLLEQNGRTVRTKEDLRRVIEGIKRGDDTNVEKLTDRIWTRMQTEPEGTSLPRKEFFEFLYDTSFVSEARDIVRKMDKAAGVGDVPFVAAKPEQIENDDGTRVTGRPIIKKSIYHSIPITDAIRASVAQGQPLYSISRPDEQTQETRDEITGQPTLITENRVSAETARRIRARNANIAEAVRRADSVSPRGVVTANAEAGSVVGAGPASRRRIPRLTERRAVQPAGAAMRPDDALSRDLALADASGIARIGFEALGMVDGVVREGADAPLRLLAIGSEADVYTPVRGGDVVYKVFRRDGETGQTGARLSIGVRDGKLIADLRTGTLGGLIERISLSQEIGATPTEIVGILPYGNLVVKQPFGAESQGADPLIGEVIRTGIDIIPRSDVGGRALLSGVLGVTAINGQPHIVADMKPPNAVMDNSGRGRFVDVVVAPLTPDILQQLGGQSSIARKAAEAVAKENDRTTSFSRSPSSRGLSVPSVRSTLRAAGIDADFEVSEDFDTWTAGLPAGERATIRAQAQRDVRDGNVIDGLFYKGRRILFARHLGSPAEVMVAARHEIMHDAIAQIPRAEWNKIGYLTYGGRWKGLVRKIEKDYGYENGTPEFMDELIAHTYSLRGSNPTLWQRFVAAVRAALRKIGLVRTFNDADVAVYAAYAMARRAEARQGGGVAMMSQSTPPVKVYHGAPSAESRSGDRYYTTSRKVAEAYTWHRGMWRTPSKTSDVREAWISFKNPLVIDAQGTRSDNIPVPWQEWKPKVFGNLPSNAVGIKDLVERAKRDGHDGLIVNNVIDTADIEDRTKSDVYVDFDGKAATSDTGVRFSQRPAPQSQEGVTENDTGTNDADIRARQDASGVSPVAPLQREDVLRLVGRVSGGSTSSVSERARWEGVGPADNFDSSSPKYRKLLEEAARIGFRVAFVKGGSLGGASDVESRTIFAQVDIPGVSPDSIVAHELFHAKYDSGDQDAISLHNRIDINSEAFATYMDDFLSVQQNNDAARQYAEAVYGSGEEQITVGVVEYVRNEYAGDFVRGYVDGKAFKSLRRAKESAQSIAPFRRYMPQPAAPAQPSAIPPKQIPTVARDIITRARSADILDYLIRIEAVREDEASKVRAAAAKRLSGVREKLNERRRKAIAKVREQNVEKLGAAVEKAKGTSEKRMVPRIGVARAKAAIARMFERRIHKGPVGVSDAVGLAFRLGEQAGKTAERGKQWFAAVDDAVAYSFKTLYDLWSPMIGGKRKWETFLLQMDNTRTALADALQGMQDPEARDAVIKRFLTEAFGARRRDAMRRSTFWSADATVAAVNRYLDRELHALYSDRLKDTLGGATVTSTKFKDETGRPKQVKSKNKIIPAHLHRSVREDWVALTGEIEMDGLKARDWRDLKEWSDKVDELLARSTLEQSKIAGFHGMQRDMMAGTVTQEVNDSGDEPLADGTDELPEKATIKRRAALVKLALVNFAARLTGGNRKSATAYLLGDRLVKASADAETEEFVNIADQWDAFRKAKGISDMDLIEMASVKKPITIGGKTYQWTDAARIYFAATWMDAGGRDNLIRNGWQTEGFSRTGRGRGYVGSTAEEAADRIAENMGLAQEVLSQITPKQIDVAAELVRILTDMGAKGNETSNELVGRDLFLSLAYWPLRVDRSDSPWAPDSQLATVADAPKFQTQVLDKMGLLKDRQKHGHPVLIGDAFETFNDHAHLMSHYIHMAVPVRDALSILKNAEVFDAIAKRWSPRAVATIVDRIYRLSGTRTLLDDARKSSLVRWAARMERNISVSMLWMRLTSILKNRIGGGMLMSSQLTPSQAARFWMPTSMPFNAGPANKAAREALMRNGYFRKRWAADLARSMASAAELSLDKQSARNKFAYNYKRLQNFGLRPMALAEMENAVKLYRILRADGMSESEAVAEAERLTRMTQNPSSAAEETGMYEHVKRGGVGLFLPFFGQPSVAADLLAGSLMQVKYDRKQGVSTAQSRKRMAATAAGLAANLAFSIALEEFVRNVKRGDDDDEPEKSEYEQQIALARRLVRILVEVADLAQPGAGKIMEGIGAFATEIATGRPQEIRDENMFAAMVSSGQRAVRDIIKGAAGEGDVAQERLERGATDAIEVAGKLTGGPAGGPVQIFEMAVGAADMLTDGESGAWGDVQGARNDERELKRILKAIK